MSSGTGDKVKGRVKEAAGALAGDKKLKNEGEPNETVLELSLQNLKRYLGVLNQHLEGIPFLCNELSIADFAIAATLSPRRAAQIDLAPYGAVTTWLGRIESRESWKKNIWPAFA